VLFAVARETADWRWSHPLILFNMRCDVLIWLPNPPPAKRWFVSCVHRVICDQLRWNACCSFLRAALTLVSQFAQLFGPIYTGAETGLCKAWESIVVAVTQIWRYARSAQAWPCEMTFITWKKPHDLTQLVLRHEPVAVSRLLKCLLLVMEQARTPKYLLSVGM